MRSKKAIYNILTNLLLQIIAIVYGFVVPKIIIDNFGSDINGLISSITQFLAYIALLESGFGPVVKSALYKPVAKKDHQEIAKILSTSERFFKKIALIFIAYIAVLCLIFPFVAEGFDTLFTISLVTIIGISTFAEYFFGMTYRLYLQSEQKTYIISLIQTLTYILSIAVIVLLAASGASIILIKLISSLVLVLRPILQNLYVKKKYNIKLEHKKSEYKLEQKWDGLAQHIAAVIHDNTDITIITLFCSFAEVSVYAVYMLVVKGLKQLIQAFNNGIDASFGDMIAKNETENLRRKFSTYETLYFTITTVVFTCAMLLITPFIGIYTRGVTDANYIRPIFGYLIVISEYIWAIRLPYSSTTLAAGHFKETRKGAWVEAFSNIILSLVLVPFFGIEGVAIGTIVAMTIRTVEFAYHTNKYVIRRNLFVSIKKILAVIAETIIIFILCSSINLPEITSITSWCTNAVIIFLVASVITFFTDLILFKKDFAFLTRLRGKIHFKHKK